MNDLVQETISNAGAYELFAVAVLILFGMVMLAILFAGLAIRYSIRSLRRWGAANLGRPVELRR
jgi:hypothetical protein